MQERRFYAAFAGINAYPDSPLSGCVQDVLKMDRLFREQCAAQEGFNYLPAYYLQPNTADARLLEQYGTALGTPVSWQPATFENITQQLFGHFKEAKAGDICVFFYSGHGSQTEAPPQFHFNNPGRKLQTLVCADSRTGARDLTNKELAYLLWKAFGNTEAHCLVITDCCHAGGNTRALRPQGTSKEFRTRFHADAGRQLAFTDLLGHDAPGFYTAVNGEMKPAIARYVHLAACRSDELAQESWRGGLFTARLADTLRANGGTTSYRDLMWRLQSVVNSAAGQQHPVVFATNDADLDRKFLSDALQPIVPQFDVLFDVSLQRWKVFGGAIHGLVPGTLLQVRDGATIIETELREVEAMFALADLPGLDEASETARATVIRAAAPAVTICSAPDHLLETAWRAGRYPLMDLRFGVNGAGYEVFRPADGSFVLLESGRNLPLFRRTPNAALFLDHAHRVANWLAVRDWKRLDPHLGREHFELKWSVTDGTVTGDDVALTYHNGDSPGFSLSIALKANAPVEQCFARALYLGSKYDIFTELLRSDLPLTRGGDPVHLSYINEGRTETTIPVSIDELYPTYNRYEITDYLKIVVSTADFRVDRFTQASLELDQPGSRGIGLSAKNTFGKDIGESPLWSIFNCSITTAFEGLEIQSDGGKKLRLGPLEITTPDAFTGKLTLLPERKISPADPAAWGDNINENALDGGMAAIRIDTAVSFRPEAPLYVLQPAPAVAVRQLPDHIIIPYAPDPVTGAYIPVGFQDKTSRIAIVHLPSPDVQFRRVYIAVRNIGLTVYAKSGKVWKQESVYGGEGPAVLLIDGIAGNAELMWRVFSGHAAAPQWLARFDFTVTDNPAAIAGMLASALAAAGITSVKIVTHGMGKQLAQLAGITEPGTLIFTGKEEEGQTTGELLRILTVSLRDSGAVKAIIPVIGEALRMKDAHDPATVAAPEYPEYLMDTERIRKIMNQIIPH
ncbi:caspase family protein [Chitinophaga deserti]|uniref:caspase family protein n=1 Tax=Chitinophaga deserti TaxID=2164099 RepID=UPI000D6D1F5C|nr:caspase family protein [Chitinophaga deserti]